MSAYLKILSVPIIALLGVLVYSNSFHCSFHFDDYFFIVNNYALKNLQNLQDIWNFLPCRFVFYLSLALNYHWGQDEVFGYHVVNLSIHLISAFLVWWLALLTLSTPHMRNDKINQRAPLMALLMALIFVSHPIQTQAVTYIMQRAASMGTMFYLAGLCCYAKSRILKEQSTRAGGSIFFYTLALMMTVIAMFTKEITITLPLIITLYEFCFFTSKNKFSWNSVIPFLLTIGIIPITMYLTKAGNAPSTLDMQKAIQGTMGISSGQYLCTQFKVILTYIRLLVAPIHQNLDYDYPVSQSFFEIPTLIGFCALMAILWGAIQLFAKYRLLSFSIFWFFITLIPESSIFPIKDVIFEHRLYLPMVGYCLFIVAAVYYLLGKKSIPAMIILLTVVIGVNSFLTYQRNKIWKNDFTLWDDNVKKSPHKSMPYLNRGKFYLEEGQIDKAMMDFNKAIELDPDYALPYNNRGNIYNKENNFAQAMMDYDKAISLDPQYTEAYYNRAVINEGEGNFVQAIPDLNKVIELNPHLPEAYDKRGVAYEKTGHFSQAMPDFNQAIELKPLDAGIYLDRGVAYADQNNFDQALLDFNKAIELDPKLAESYENLGSLYFREGDLTQAILDYNKAIQLNPKNAQIYYNLATAQNHLNNTTQTMADLNKAIELNPHYAEAYNFRGVIYATQNNFLRAIDDFNKAISSKPHYTEAYKNAGLAYYKQAIAFYQFKHYNLAWNHVHKAAELGYALNPDFLNALKAISGRDH